MEQSPTSACDLLLYRTNEEVWYRGEDYVKKERVKNLVFDEKSAQAFVTGSHPYQVKLCFRSGGLSKSCNCPYTGKVCKHMVAVAILWDKSRGIPRPSKEMIETETIPPPEVTKADMNQMYNDPLHANLDKLRIVADERGWSRTHAHLPNMPSFETDTSVPLTLEEVQKTLLSVRKWTQKDNYDMYFCAGEMVSAYCKVLRCIYKRVEASDIFITAQILRESQKFHYELVMDMIDGSDGLHVFTEAHLEHLFNIIQDKSKNQKNVQEKLTEFEKHRDDY